MKRPLWLHTLFDWLRYGKQYHPPSPAWERYPESLEIGRFTYTPGKPLHYSNGIWTSLYLKQHPELKRSHIEDASTVRVNDINAKTARELQRYLDKHRPQSAHYEPPSARTDAISLEKINSAIHFHKAHLLPFNTAEMQAIVDTEKRQVV